MFRMFRKQFPKVQDAWTLAHAIVDTVRESLIVLDQDLRVVAASRSFYLTFKVNADDTQGKPWLYIRAWNEKPESLRP